MPTQEDDDAAEFQRAFGRRVRAARVSEGLSQEQLGQRAGLHRNHVGGIERGERNLTLRNLYRLARALGLPTRDLFA